MADGNPRRAAIQHLEDLLRAGVTDLPRPHPVPARTEDRGEDMPPTPQRPLFEDQEPETEPTAEDGWGAAVPQNPAAALAVVQEEVSECVRCSELARTRTQTVFGVGSPQARLCFLGEAPGADEDRQGEPFVGRAGQLLTKIIEACTLRREEVYILNTLKCRPPGNRNPAPLESENCREFLDRQLAIIQPEYICCLGAVAAKALLQIDGALGKMRGRFFRYRGAAVICTYHPAYLLRNPSAKRDVWEDMKMLMQEMGIDVETGQRS